MRLNHPTCIWLVFSLPMLTIGRFNSASSRFHKPFDPCFIYQIIVYARESRSRNEPIERQIKPYFAIFVD